MDRSNGQHKLWIVAFQKRAIRFVTQAYYMDHTEPRMKKMKANKQQCLVRIFKTSIKRFFWNKYNDTCECNKPRTGDTTAPKTNYHYHHYHNHRSIIIRDGQRERSKSDAIDQLVKNKAVLPWLHHGSWMMKIVVAIWITRTIRTGIAIGRVRVEWEMWMIEITFPSLRISKLFVEAKGKAVLAGVYAWVKKVGWHYFHVRWN